MLRKYDYLVIISLWLLGCVWWITLIILRSNSSDVLYTNAYYSHTTTRRRPATYLSSSALPLWQQYQRRNLEQDASSTVPVPPPGSSRQCSLSEDIIPFRFQALAGAYVRVMTNDTEVGGGSDGTNSGWNWNDPTISNETVTQTKNTILDNATFNNSTTTSSSSSNTADNNVGGDQSATASTTAASMTTSAGSTTESTSTSSAAKRPSEGDTAASSSTSTTAVAESSPAASSSSATAASPAGGNPSQPQVAFASPPHRLRFLSSANASSPPLQISATRIPPASSANEQQQQQKQHWHSPTSPPAPNRGGIPDEDVPRPRTFVQKDGVVVNMRACWCAAFFDMDIPYCPAQFDTCLVQSANNSTESLDPAAAGNHTGGAWCYNTMGADGFVRSFWPIALVWGVALLYALWCSETGGSAREFMRRQWWCCYCCAPDDPDELLHGDLQRLLERQPERAAYLYRQAIYRLRQPPRRRRTRATTTRSQSQSSNGGTSSSSWWQWFSFGGLAAAAENNNASDNSGNSGNNNNNNIRRDDNSISSTNTSQRQEGVFLEAPYEALTLRIKVYHVDRRYSHIRSDGTVRSAGGGPIGSSGGVGGVEGGWLQFRREQVTLEEMDDEMEHGVRCAICLMRLEEGDVVGDIPCRHVFHKDCLKRWLKRANRCPLCQQGDIATLRSYHQPMREIIPTSTSTTNTAHPPTLRRTTMPTSASSRTSTAAHVY